MGTHIYNLRNFARVTKRYFSEDLPDKITPEFLHSIKDKAAAAYRANPDKKENSLRGLNNKEQSQFFKSKMDEEQNHQHRLEQIKMAEDAEKFIDIAMTLFLVGDLVFLGRQLIKRGLLSPKVWNKMKNVLFAKFGKSAPNAAKSVNLTEYVASKGLKFKPASKFQQIVAKQAKGGEEIITKLDNGLLETKNVAQPGDWIVNNYGKGAGSEKWIIKDATFKKKYVPVSGEIYKPAGGPMNATKVTEDIKFVAPWGEEMTVEKGGYILQDPKNPADMYGIGKDEFLKTYKFTN